MIFQTSIMVFMAHIFLLLGLPTALVGATPMTAKTNELAVTERAASSYWVGSIKRQGVAPFNSNTDYQVFRNVKEFGAKGKLVTRCPCPPHTFTILTMSF
jgi:glucan 1,3-beta-glucosidase